MQADPALGEGERGFMDSTRNLSPLQEGRLGGPLLPSYLLSSTPFALRDSLSSWWPCEKFWLYDSESEASILGMEKLLGVKAKQPSGETESQSGEMALNPQ